MTYDLLGCLVAIWLTMGFVVFSDRLGSKTIKASAAEGAVWPYLAVVSLWKTLRRVGRDI